jgi:P-aminobenzoate N-oxygenase AurF
MSSSKHIAFEAFEAAWLRAVFQRALGAALASSLAAAGCGESADECQGAARQVELTEIEPRAPFDYASIRTASPKNKPNPGGRPETGEACSGADDVAACNANFAELLEQPVPGLGGVCGMGGCWYLYTTAGDEVHRYATVPEMLEFLGPIDAEADANLLFQWAGYSPCGSADIRKVDGGFEATVVKLIKSCPVESERVDLRIRTDGKLVELSSVQLPSTDVCVGRRPPGLVAARQCDAYSPLARHFAAIAELEAASVAAFETIARELEEYGAPAGLIAEARSAAADEVRHARATARVARRFGATPRAPRVVAHPTRSLEVFATDNATEGCVRETFGALVGHYQAATARDPEVAALMARIAEDETRHAALAQSIARWGTPRLTTAARERIAGARAEAIAMLLSEIASNEPAPAVRALAGVPDGATATALLVNLTREWPAPVETHA